MSPLFDYNYTTISCVCKYFFLRATTDTTQSKNIFKKVVDTQHKVGYYDFARNNTK